MCFGYKWLYKTYPKSLRANLTRVTSNPNYRWFLSYLLCTLLLHFFFIFYLPRVYPTRFEFCFPTTTTTKNGKNQEPGRKNRTMIVAFPLHSLHGLAMFRWTQARQFTHDNGPTQYIPTSPYNRLEFVNITYLLN